MKLWGFTFVELLITLILIGLLTCLGIVSSVFFIQKNEQQSVLNEIRAIVKYARIKAFSRGGVVYLSPLDPNRDWSKGIQLIEFAMYGSEPRVLYQWQWHHPHWQLEWKGVNSNRRILFSNNPMHAISNGQFILKNRHSQDQIKIVLNRIGRLRIVTT